MKATDIILFFAAALVSYLVSGLNPAIILSRAIHHKDIRTCVREAEALGMSYGNYVAAGLDRVAWDGHGRDADEQAFWHHRR